MCLALMVCGVFNHLFLATSLLLIAKLCKEAKEAWVSACTCDAVMVEHILAFGNGKIA